VRVNFKENATLQLVLAIGLALVGTGWLVVSLTTSGSSIIFGLLAMAFYLLAVGWWKMSRHDGDPPAGN
jgi:hypothetical protein